MDIERIFDTSDYESLNLKWGLRGDPYLWEELRNLAVNKEFKSKSVFESFLDDNFKKLTQAGILSDDKSRVYIEKFNHGGISGGWVSIDTWMSRILPLLKSRY